MHHALHHGQHQHIPERSPLNMYRITIAKTFVPFTAPSGRFSKRLLEYGGGITQHVRYRLSMHTITP